jgi:hypothetical protein
MKKDGFRIKGRQRSVHVAAEAAKLLELKLACAPEPWKSRP